MNSLLVSGERTSDVCISHMDPYRKGQGSSVCSRDVFTPHLTGARQVFIR